MAFAVVERENSALLSVSDDGPGIPASARELVFDRFTRLDDARNSAAGGVGLGLAITRDIVARHGGTVIVDPGYQRELGLLMTLPPPASVSD